MSELNQYYCEDADHIDVGKNDQIIRLGDTSLRDTRSSRKLKIATIIKYPHKDKDKGPGPGTYNYIVMGDGSPNDRLYMYEQNPLGDVVAKITPTKAKKLGLTSLNVSLAEFKEKILGPDSGLSPEDLQAIFSERIGHAYLAKVCAIDSGHPDDTRVVAAGEIVVRMNNRSKVAVISNSSGHYTPSGAELPHVIKLFKRYTGLTQVTATNVSSVRSASKKKTKRRRRTKKTKKGKRTKKKRKTKRRRATY